jgi:SAM-dependent methyltransferase
MGFEAGSFDIIWSEGAFFVMGISEALAACHEILKPGGLMALSELCWLRPDVPKACSDFFAAEYAAIADVGENLSVIEAREFDVLEYFALSESAWWDSYYNPLEERITALREKVEGDASRIEMVEGIQAEIDLYREFSDYYGYVFYCLMRR